MRQIISLNRGWEFTEHWSDGFARGAAVEASVVDLPHTVRQTPLHYFDESAYQMTAGYRRTLILPESASGKRILLCAGAAGHYAEVYADGRLVGSHKGGYTAFSIDLSDFLTPGQPTVLSIMVDSRESLNIPPFGHVIDYMTYGGLYRTVWLEIREESDIDDVFAVPTIPGVISTSENPKLIASLTFSGTITSHITLHGADGMQIRQRVTRRDDDTILAEKTFAVGDPYEITVPSAKLWDIESPALYTLRTELIDGGEVLDRVETRIGFRRSEFRADGYYLNGRRVRLRGLNRHQSYPYVGYAMPRSMQRYDADILKTELGLNAVRTSHYPQSHDFIGRCDELGLLVFTEIPGWQHIGDDAWKDVAVLTAEEMVRQYRDHPSVILWGVRINESQDDDAFYTRTNEVAHRLDPTRPTGGVRYLKKSSLLEDVYTYNDFSHDGTAPGCEPKKAVTSDRSKPYLISEYCGHMYPTKSYDNEELRAEHALRHARVLNAVAGQEDIAGAFGWCFFDYNTHRDFGSGDRICYHGVCDMFRNPKLAAAVYASQQEKEPVLEISSDMNIGEHPASVRGRIYAFTNADSVRFYKNGVFIREFDCRSEEFADLRHPPVEIDDFVGDRIEKGEDFPPKQAQYVKDILNDSARFGMNHLPLSAKRKAAWLMTRCHMSFADAYRLYGKYIENWGDSASVYRFEAVKNGKVVRTVTKKAFTQRRLEVRVSHAELTEGDTYDVAAVRLRMTDQNGCVLPCLNSYIKIGVEGPLGVIGPDHAPIIGGMGGFYVRTMGKEGNAAVTLQADGCDMITLNFAIKTENAGSDISVPAKKEDEQPDVR